MLIKNLNVQINKQEVLNSMECYADSPLFEELSKEYEVWLPKAEACIDACAFVSLEKIPSMEKLNPELAGKEAVYVLLSLGDAVSKLSLGQFEKNEYLIGMLIDTIADQYLFHMEQALWEPLCRLCMEQQKGIARRLEVPGDLPMEFQRVIWKAVDAQSAGISVKESFMLEPLKSMTYVLLLSEDMDDFHIEHDCETCGNVNCKMRSISPVTVTLQSQEQVQKFICEKQVSLLELLQKANVLLTSFCGGKGTCGKCRIRLVKGTLDITDKDRQFLSEKELSEGIRLACRAYPKADCTVSVDIGTEDEYFVLSDFQKKDTTETLEDKNIQAETKTDTDRTDLVKCTNYGIGIDIGTTTIAMQLIELPNGKILDTYSSLNRQRRFGADVISRMEASNAGKSDELQKSIQKDLQKGINRLCSSINIEETELKQITIAGNTTMIHLLLRLSCETLGVYPFTPVMIERMEGSGELLGLALPNIKVVVLPGISTFVGADIAAGLLSCGFDKAEKVSMLVDLGTNGEMAIGNRERILCTSTAAGPAFEGGNISCGVGSVSGAICGVELSEDKINLKTIGSQPPCGICGTGIVEAIAELVKAGYVDETGKYEDAYFEEGFSLGRTMEGKEILITQKDIREFQMAKAAICAGVEILCRRFGISYEEIDKVYLAGGFGYQMNVQKAVEIGLFPKELQGKIQPVGNSSLKGTLLDLSDLSATKREQELVAKATELSLATDAEFQERYMESMNLCQEVHRI